MDNLDNIEEYLKTHENKDMLRFLTCGSVDDGKSTLIGRLLYDSKMIFEDQLSAVEAESKKYGTTGDKLDMALLVDGLQSEREQGITIDVAYRFFTTDKRKFIIADTPGHEQYTRNMVTGASTADVAIILIDARKGILTQTRRHSFIVSLLGIEHVVVAVNKMDLVDFSKDVFDEIKDSYTTLADELEIKNRYFIPLSALDGDNVVNISKHTPWYDGKALLELLDTMDISKDTKEEDFRFPVQYVNRPNLDFRGFCGTIASGSVKEDDEITVLPSGKTTKVKTIVDASLLNQEQTKSSKIYHAPMAITITTQDEVDISRGDMLVHTKSMPRVSNALKVMLVWMDEKPMQISKQYDIKRATSVISGSIEHINYKIDVNTYKREQVKQLELNDIASCKILLTRPIAADNYKENRDTGSFIVVDKATNKTVGAGMIVDVAARESDKLQEENIYDIWNTKKKDLEKKKGLKTFRQRDILLMSVGKNIGNEQCGKGEEFLRPVLVYRKFNKRTFLAIPLSAQKKDGSYYFSFSFKDKISTANFSQVKTLDIKRIKYKMGTMKTSDFKKLAEKFVKLMEFTPQD